MGKLQVPRTLGLILAGGRGTRMGGVDKALLILDGEPLVTHVLRRLQPQVDGVAISSNRDAEAAFQGLSVLPDPPGGFAGPLAGVLAGLEHARSVGLEAVVSAAVDTPFFPVDLARRLASAGGGLALAASGAGLHPTFGYWPVQLAGDLRRFLASGGRKMREFTGAQGAAEVAFSAEGGDPFFNINTPAHLATALSLCKTGR